MFVTNGRKETRCSAGAPRRCPVAKTWTPDEGKVATPSVVSRSLAMRRERVEAAIRYAHPAWSGRQVRAEAAMAMNFVGAFAPRSCSGGSRAARRVFGRASTAYDHVLVATASEPESGPEPALRRRDRRKAFIRSADWRRRR
jgi:hypothetical protein